MSMGERDSENDFGLVPQPPRELEVTRTARSRIISEMVDSSLELARVSSVAQVDLDALVREGKRLYRGKGMTDGDIQAFGLFLRAAERGHSEAQYLLSTCYLYGHGIEKDVVQSLEWHQKSAESGFAQAQYERGLFGREGTGVAQDYTEAAKWFRKAAEQGHVNAQSELGYCYTDGEGVPQDYVEAVKWFRKAAEQGNDTSQHNLGLMYENGQGVPQDYPEAAKWYGMAAEQGNAGSQNNLGSLLEKGDGVTQDYAAAIEWYQKAADGGDASALSNLNRLISHIELKKYQEIIFAFSDLIATQSPLIGDSSMLPHPKETILYAIKFVVDDYETKRELTTNHTLVENYDEMIATFNYLFTILARDWHEIAPEDKNAISKLAECDSFPDWALPLKLKYIDEDRALKEACSATLRVLEDKVNRENRSAMEADDR